MSGKIVEFKDLQAKGLDSTIRHLPNELLLLVLVLASAEIQLRFGKTDGTSKR